MIAYSGRGAYALWLLKDEHSDYAPAVDAQTCHLWRLNLDALLILLEDLNADTKATRLAQWVKAPGTMDTKTNNRVVYIPFFVGQDDGSVKVPRYTLKQLAHALGVCTLDAPVVDRDDQGRVVNLLPRSTYSPRSTRTRDGSPTRADSVWIARCRDLEALAQYRGRIPEGSRYQWCCFYGWAMLQLYQLRHPWGMARTMAWDQLRRFNASLCSPPLPTDTLGKVLLVDHGIPRPRVQSVVKALGITVDEANALRLTTLVPEQVRDSREQERRPLAQAKRESRQGIEAMIRAGKTNTEIYRVYSSNDRIRAKVCRRRKALGITDPTGSSQVMLGEQD